MKKRNSLKREKREKREKNLTKCTRKDAPKKIVKLNLLKLFLRQNLNSLEKDFLTIYT